MARRQQLHFDDSELHEACKKGRVRAIKRLLERQSVDVNAYNKHGETPLHALMRCTDDSVPEIIDLLIEYGADVNAVTLPEGDTSLHRAMKFQASERLLFSVLSLLEHEADPLLKNKSLRSAYDVAVAKGHAEVIKLLDCDDPESVVDELQDIAKKRYGMQLIKAIIDSDDTGIDRCLRNFPPLDLQNEHGAGAIHYAVTHYRRDVINLLHQLTEAGVDVNFEDHEGDTALNLALKSRRLKVEGTLDELVQFLVVAGTNPNIEDLDGNNAIDLAKKHGHDHLIELLEEAADSQYLDEQERRDRISRRIDRTWGDEESRVRLVDDESYDYDSQDEGGEPEHEEEEDSRAKQNWAKAQKKTKVCVVS